MAQVRALTTLFHEGTMRKAGDVFDYEAADALKNPAIDGMELVTKKSNAAFAKAQAEAHQALVDTAAALHANYDALKAELDADPTRGDLVQKVLDAEAAAAEADKAVAADAQSDLV